MKKDLKSPEELREYYKNELNTEISHAEAVKLFLLMHDADKTDKVDKKVEEVKENQPPAESIKIKVPNNKNEGYEKTYPYQGSQIEKYYATKNRQIIFNGIIALIIVLYVGYRILDNPYVIDQWMSQLNYWFYNL